MKGKEENIGREIGKETREEKEWNKREEKTGNKTRKEKGRNRK